MCIVMLRLTRSVRRQWAWRQHLLLTRRPCSSKPHPTSAVYGWGAASSGQLGKCAGTMETRPVEVTLPLKAAHAACGDCFTVLSSRSSNKLTLVGLDVTSSPCDVTKQSKCTDRSEPVSYELPTESANSEVLQIACGRCHIMVLTDEGVFAAGGNSVGQCGIGVNKRAVEQFTRVPLEAGQQIKQIVCGLDHSLLLTRDGQVLSCGWGADGQTGMGHYDNSFTATQVEADLGGVKIKQVASTVDSCLAVSEEGLVFSWGNNEYSQLGLDMTEEQVCQPSHSSLLQHLGPMAQVGTVGSFSVALTASGEVYVWGYGALGLGPDVTSVKTARRLDSLIDSGHTITQLMCGTDHVALLTDSGNLIVWGRGSYGRLGLGGTCDQWTPRQVHLPGRVTGVSCCTSHMTAVVGPR